ncbi:TylF/MycF family methyltransferase [uncultured Tenacibaculum sp.]|uniref:TylF/MycF family methyltransferase n=1 Tax=Tenacibaculum halocynthiae TaxID=1254437 RepID=UPI0026368D6C|nr:TylF/MycF family methyltransferase [uncultured Tenacibaculum sp.]
MNNPIYIEHLKNLLLDTVNKERLAYGEYIPLDDNNFNWKLKIIRKIDKFIRKRDIAICRLSNAETREEGRDWPSYADTMIGLKRLENIQFCFNEIIKDNIPGDFIETGVWRGGATIFMKALLNDLKIKDRNVWVADSFEGLPPPNETLYPEDKGDLHDTKSDHLAISLETVKYNFQKYDLLDDSVKFLKGWFKDTLPTAPIEKLSIIRLDGDMYESTMDGLVNLYPKLSKGGFIIIDDWGAVEACKKAVIDYRKTNNITEEIKTIDWTGAYWRKSF